MLVTAGGGVNSVGGDCWRRGYFSWRSYEVLVTAGGGATSVINVIKCW